MPKPIAIGPPRDWRVAKQPQRSTLHRQAELNQQKQCRICSKPRAGISNYCAPHRDTKSLRGDPLARLPKANELKILFHAADLFLKANPTRATEVSINLRHLESTKTPPRSHCLRYGDMHRKLPQAAKAQGALANYIHKQGKTYTDAVNHALVLKAWVSIYFDGLSENRRGFLETTAGGIVGNIRMQPMGRSKGRTKKLSGAAKRRLGRQLLQHTTEAYGPTFWDSEVTCADGSQMTLQQYAKLALRVAGLYPHKETHND